ncbi:MAG: hypothetical protein ACYC0O_09880 [Desulfurivibrionaceae bacterium]
MRLRQGGAEPSEVFGRIKDQDVAHDCSGNAAYPLTNTPRSGKSS